MDNFDPTTYGISPELWSSATPADQALIESMVTLGKATYSAGMTNFSINADTWNKALQLAQTDPDIKAKYGDAATVGLNDLQNSLAYTNAEYAQATNLQNAQDIVAQKQLAQSEAAAGRAYSGFRAQAENLQKQQQQAVIQSSQRANEQTIRNTLGNYEQKFGSTAMQANVPQTTGQPVYGGLTGTQPQAQKQDIYNKAAQEYSAAASPLQ